MRVLQLLTAHGRTLAHFDAWQGFDPLEIPLALFDGERSYLWRHPRPPETFESLAAHPEVSMMQGRYTDLTAHSHVDIAGVDTATILYDPLDAETTPPEWSALITHEAFHVYQEKTFRQSYANEADLFLYPVDNAALLKLRRTETYALREALNAADKQEKIAWAATTLEARRQRFEMVEVAFANYERSTELREGTALYIEHKVNAKTLDLPAQGFAAPHVRQRCYKTGAALCLLLETFTTDWQKRLEILSDLYLDTLLAEVLPASSASKRLSEERVRDITTRAYEDVEKLRLEREQVRTHFDTAPCWKVTVIAPTEAPLKLQGFDPMNVSLVEGGILHKRYLKLGSSKGELEVFGTQCLTQSFGEHPLHSGVKCVTIHLEAAPSITKNDRAVQIRADGFTASFSHVKLRSKKQHVVLELGQRE